MQEKTLIIEGMMCTNCERHVKTALEGVPGVESALVDHTNGTAVLSLAKDVPAEELLKAVEDAGYTARV